MINDSVGPLSLTATGFSGWACRLSDSKVSRAAFVAKSIDTVIGNRPIDRTSMVRVPAGM